MRRCGARSCARCGTDDVDPAHADAAGPGGDDEEPAGARGAVLGLDRGAAVGLPRAPGDDEPGARAAVPVGVASQPCPAADACGPGRRWSAGSRWRPGVPRFSTHTTRHLCLTDLARMGWELHAIADVRRAPVHRLHAALHPSVGPGPGRRSSAGRWSTSTPGGSQMLTSIGGRRPGGPGDRAAVRGRSATATARSWQWPVDPARYDRRRAARGASRTRSRELGRNLCAAARTPRSGARGWQQVAAPAAAARRLHRQRWTGTPTSHRRGRCRHATRSA